jgi:hypothetical protein
MISAFAILLGVLVGVAQRPASTLPRVQDGDIIFQTSRSSQSLAIQRATGSRYSHMGMIVHRGGRPYVLEAVATVRYTPLDTWIARGVEGRFVVKRLKDSRTVLTPATTARLRRVAEEFLGRRYDLTFEWSDERVYCSELVWKAYDRAFSLHIGELQRIRDFNLTDPTVQGRLRQRYGDHVPLDEPVISPVAMFESPVLITVAQR